MVIIAFLGIKPDTLSQAAKTVPENEVNESSMAKSSESRRTQVNEGKKPGSGRQDVYA